MDVYNIHLRSNDDNMHDINNASQAILDYIEKIRGKFIKN
jgi:hypothetical protein